MKLYCDASIFQWGLQNDFSCSVHTLCALYGSKSLQPVFICYHQIFIILIHIPHTLYSLISTDFIFTDWWSTTWTCGGWNTVLSNISPSPLHFCQPLNEPCSSLSLLFGAKRKNCCSVVWKDTTFLKALKLLHICLQTHPEHLGTKESFKHQSKTWNIEKQQQPQSVNSPQSLQSTVWTLQSSTQKLHSWIMQLVSTHVQLCQMGGVGLQSWGHNFTVRLWESTLSQSVMIENIKCVIIKAENLHYKHRLNVYEDKTEWGHNLMNLLFTSVLQLLLLCLTWHNDWVSLRPADF